MNQVRRILRRADHGSAIVELAISLPILIVILVATIDFARVFYLGIALTNAARSGAQWGSTSVANSGNTTLMETTAVNASSVSGVTATAATNCECATDAGTISATTPANTCTGTCATGSHLVVTVTVTTTGTFNRVITGIPGLPTSMTLSRSATMRVAN